LCESFKTDYFVNEIVGERYNKKKGCDEYKVIWEGFAESDFTWEPASNLANCVIFVDYMEEKERKKDSDHEEDNAVPPSRPKRKRKREEVDFGEEDAQKIKGYSRKRRKRKSTNQLLDDAVQESEEVIQQIKNDESKMDEEDTLDEEEMAPEPEDEEVNNSNEKGKSETEENTGNNSSDGNDNNNDTEKDEKAETEDEEKEIEEAKEIEDEEKEIEEEEKEEEKEDKEMAEEKEEPENDDAKETAPVEFIVEKILKAKVEKDGSKKWLVQWKGDKTTTWEPYENFVTNGEVNTQFSEFEKKQQEVKQDEKEESNEKALISPEAELDAYKSQCQKLREDYEQLKLSIENQYSKEVLAKLTIQKQMQIRGNLSDILDQRLLEIFTKNKDGKVKPEAEVQD